LFALLSVVLIAANVDTAVRIGSVAKITGSTTLLLNEVAGTVGVVAIVLIPWIAGGLHPIREDFAWAILLSFAAGFVSICALVLSTFDIARVEAAGGTWRKER
jgi:hypothetical protein